MQRVIFFAIVLLVLGSGYGYLGWRLIQPLPWSQEVRRALWLVLLLSIGVIPVAFSLRASMDPGLGRDLLQWTAYLMLGFLALVFAGTVLRDLGWLALRGIDAVIGWMSGGEPPVRLLPADPERRKMLTSVLNAGVVATSGGMVGYGVTEARRRARFARVDVPVKGLPKALEGLRIVQLSDIHVGPTIRRPYVEAVVEAVNTLDADMIALTGDMIDGFVDQMRDDVAPIGELKSKYGTFFVTGNHEYYWDGAAWSEEAGRMGMHVLTNAHKVIEHNGRRVVVAGVTDHSTLRMRPGRGPVPPGHVSDPHKALEGAPEADFKLLLAHQPKSIYEAAKAGFDLQLSGHTHGGQFYPWNLVVGLAHPFTAGLHLFEQTQIYVSRGTGYWGPPIRIGAPSEITILTLRAA